MPSKVSAASRRDEDYDASLERVGVFRASVRGDRGVGSCNVNGHMGVSGEVDHDTVYVVRLGRIEVRLCVEHAASLASQLTESPSV